MKQEQLNIIYYDIETTDIPNFKGHGYKTKCISKTTLTSVAFKEQGKEPVAFTIGVNCKDLKDLKKQINIQ